MTKSIVGRVGLLLFKGIAYLLLAGALISVLLALLAPWLAELGALLGE